jgi:hypothetical protein
MRAGDRRRAAGASRSAVGAGIAATSLLMALVAVATAGPAFAAAPEAPMTEAATAVTGTTATLNGELNPGSSAEVGYDFTYARGESCSEGATTPEGGPVNGEAIKVSTPVSELEANTEYTFCLVANHPEGELIESTPGPPQSLKTLASSPVVVSSGAAAPTPFGATLEAQVNPENEATTACLFEYGETSAYGASAECSPSAIEGSEAQLLSANVTGLEPATSYHFRIVIANGTGETQGTDGEFTTLALASPLVGGESVSALTASHATLNAQVNPNYQETSYAVEYATNEQLTGATTTPGESALPAEFAELPVSLPTGPLLAGTTYYYRFVAENGAGKSEGPIEHFTTIDTPTVDTGVAQNITRTSATASGTIDPAGDPTTYRFVYAVQASYEAGLAAATDPYNQSTATGNLPAGYETEEIGPVLLSELQPGTTYHYALVAGNSVGTTTGADATFTTAPPTPPLVTTGAAEGVTQTGATIHGGVDTRGLSTIVSFEFGTTPFSGSATPATVDSGSGTTLSVSAAFGNYLQPGVTYYYRVVASSRDGTSYGAELSFTTGAFPSPFTFPGALPLLPNPDALEERPASKPTPTHLTKQQKLAKALKACKRKPKKQRAACRRLAQKRFGTHHK